MADTPDIEGSDLSALVSNEISSARRYAENELAQKRTQNMEYFLGEMRDLPPPPNRSSVVSYDVADTISWMLPGIIRVFTASDNMALYEPKTEKDREFAQQATDYVNYLFFQDNEGYRTLYNATHDALAGGNGIVYHYWDSTPDVTITDHTRLTPPALALLMEDEGVEIVAQEQNPEPDTISVPGLDGQMQDVPVPTFNVRVKRTNPRGKLCVKTCKPENFFIDQDAVTIADARFVAYLHDAKTRSDLVEMGFDRDLVDDLAASTSRIDNAEGLARNNDLLSLRSYALKSQEFVDLYECYVKADLDGDGVAELIQVWYAGDQSGGDILDWQQWEDDIPFSDIPCYPVPHRWDATSVADRTKDVQRIKTQLLRQALDNLYASNNPMREVETGSVQNPDILVNPKFGGLIWKKPGSQPIMPHEIPFVADKAFSALDYMDMVVTKRTGVSRATMALDPGALQNQTATAVQNQRDAGYSQIELVARNMAELGWKRVFGALLKLIVKHQDRPRIIRLRDKFVEMDPRVWDAGMDVSINVGLGTGSRERDMLMLQQVLQSQIALADRFQASGAVDQALDLLPRVVSTMKKIAESAGLKNPDAFYPEFGEEQVQALKQQAAEASQKPDPKLALEQQKFEAEQQAQQAEMQMTAQMKAADMQMRQREAEANYALKQAQIDADAALKREAMSADMALKREQLVAEMNLKREQLGAELQLKRELAVLDMSQPANATSPVRVGGEPG